MKTKTDSTSSFVRHLVHCFAISYGLHFCAMAQEEKVVEVKQPDQIVSVNNDTRPVNVDGEAIEEEVTDGELQYLDGELNKQGKQIKLNSKKTQKYKKLQNTTEKLSNTTERYVEEKKASEKSIQEYNQKIKCLLDESGTDPECDEYRPEEAKKEEKKAVAPVVVAAEERVQDEAKVQQAAPVAPQVIIQNIMPENKAPEVKEAAPAEVIPATLDSSIEKNIEEDVKVEAQASDKMKIYPYLGLASFDGTGVISGMQTNTLMGIRFESRPFGGRLAMGAGITYKQLTFRDNGVPQYYVSVPGDAPESEYTNTTVDIYGKLILIRDTNFMPYILGGVGYNMMSIQQSTNNNYSNGYNNGSSNSVNRNFVTGTVGGGIDYAFTPTIGANLELNYASALSTSENTSSPYQARSEELANEFSEANVFTVQAGLVVFF